MHAQAISLAVKHREKCVDSREIGPQDVWQPMTVMGVGIEIQTEFAEQYQIMVVVLEAVMSRN